MAQIKSLKDQILERLNLKKGGSSVASSNIRKASHDFADSDAPQFRGKSKKKRHQMAVAAGLSAARGESVQPKIGDNAIYENKKCTVRSVTSTGMATIRFGNNRELIVRANKLKPMQLTEGVLGMGTILPTYQEKASYGFMKIEGIDPEDIGLIFEDDDEGEPDDQEEDHDNGSNVRHDGHTNKREVDELPTPSDTIAPAYSDKKPPKEISDPLSIHTGAEEDKLWDMPDFGGYDYPADAPEIPTANFDADDMGNSRAPHFNDEEHQAGDGLEHRDDVTINDDEDEDEDRTDESLVREAEVSDPARKKGNKNLAKMRKDLEFNENFFMSEMDDLLGPGEDTEPKSDDTITVTLPAMAAIMCTVANKVGGDRELMKAIVEALAEVSKGKTIDIDDLDAVARHVNGEELPEVENRDAGNPDHEGMTDSEDDEGCDGDDGWPGDGEPSNNGKTKLMGGMGESQVTESLNYFYGGYDVLADTKMTEEDELSMIFRRAFPKGLRHRR